MSLAILANDDAFSTLLPLASRLGPLGEAFRIQFHEQELERQREFWKGRLAKIEEMQLKIFHSRLQFYQRGNERDEPISRPCLLMRDSYYRAVPMHGTNADCACWSERFRTSITYTHPA